MENIEDVKQVLEEAARAAGALIQERFYKTNSIDNKTSLNDLVTEVDQASERLILSIIQQRFPEHGVVGEEYGTAQAASDYQWYIDPIDGTVNFAHKVPLCCVSIAVAYKGTTMLAVVYNPMMQEYFFAELGKGAFLNGQAIKVSPKADFNKAFLVTGFPYTLPEKPDVIAIFTHFLKRDLPIRRLGSAALDLCWVADGRFDAFWEQNLKPYDIAAGVLILKEAGGTVTNFNNEVISVNGQQVLATNSVMHDVMLTEIQQAMCVL